MILAGLLGLAQVQPKSQQVVLPNDVTLTIFEPDADPKGLVVSVHSVFQDQDTALPIARAMAKAGFLSISVDLKPGREFSQYVADLKSVCEKYQENLDLYLIGHSMGGDLMSNLSMEIPAKSVTILGFPADTSLFQGQKFYLVAGAWDQLHSGSKLREAVVCPGRKLRTRDSYG